MGVAELAIYEDSSGAATGRGKEIHDFLDALTGGNDPFRGGGPVREQPLIFRLFQGKRSVRQGLLPTEVVDCEIADDPGKKGLLVVHLRCRAIF